MKVFFLFFMIIFTLNSGFAQEADTGVSVENALSPEEELTTENNPATQGFSAAPRQRGDFWACPGAEAVFFSSSGISAGGGFAAAYGSKTSMGFKAAWFFDMNNELDALELNFLFRYYFMGAENAPSAGPYLQLTGGPALLFARAEDVSIPAKWGAVSAGLTFGWRFFLGKFMFVEPYVRAGYPYIAGAGVSGGVHF
jgi:hypothetical protein